jgi:gluconate kinase
LDIVPKIKQNRLKFLMKLFVFGCIGSGKSVVGQKLAEKANLKFYDGDWDLTREMKAYIACHEPFSERLREEMALILIRRMEKLGDNFCLSQGLFRNKHREIIIKRIPSVIFIWVKSSRQAIEERLRVRLENIALSEYAKIVNPLFEPPSHEHVKLNNTGSQKDLDFQIGRILKKLRVGQT